MKPEKKLSLKEKKRKKKIQKNRSSSPTMGYKIQKIFKIEDLKRENTNTPLF